MDKIYCKKVYKTLKDRENVFSDFGDYLGDWINNRMDQFGNSRLLFFILCGIPILLIISYLFLFHHAISKRVALFNEGNWYECDSYDDRFLNAKTRKFEEDITYRVYLNDGTKRVVLFSKYELDKHFADGKELRKMKLKKLDG